MIVKTTRFGELVLKFRHIRNRKGHPRATEAHLLNSNTDNGVYGVQNCHSADNFVKETGRRMALHNAIGLLLEGDKKKIQRDTKTEAEIMLQYYARNFTDAELVDLLGIGIAEPTEAN